HDSFVNPNKIAPRQRTGIDLLDVLKHNAFAIRLVDGQIGVPLQSPNFDRSSCALAEQLYESPVKLINFFSPIRDVHEDQFSVISHRKKLSVGIIRMLGRNLYRLPWHASRHLS